MGRGLSVAARAEITRKYATAFKTASKAQKTVLLDQVCEVTGWSRDNARRRLSQAVKPRRVVKRKTRARKYSFDAVKVLQRVWAVSGGQCGKYLVESMPLLLAGLEAHGELANGQARFTDTVRGELLSMSASTIDRYLTPVRQKTLLRGVSTTTPSPLLRSSNTVRKAGDEIDLVPGFFEVDTVAHCGPTMKGELVRTVNLTDMHIGWVHTVSIRQAPTFTSVTPSTTPSTPSRSRSPGWILITAVSSSTTTWLLGLPNETFTSPARGLIRKMTRQPSSRKTITWSAHTPTTGVMTLPER